MHLGGLRWRIYFSLVTSTLPATGGMPIAYSDSLDGMNTWSAPAATGLPQHGTILALNTTEGEKGATAAQGVEADSAVQPNTSPTFSGLALLSSTPQVMFNYTAGADFTGELSGVQQMSFGFNNAATWEGTAAAGSGREIYFYDRVAGAFLGGISPSSWHVNGGLTVAGTTYANRVTSPAVGTQQMFTDSTTQTWGATISGGGSYPALGLWDGSNWTVVGK